VSSRFAALSSLRKVALEALGVPDPGPSRSLAHASFPPASSSSYAAATAAAEQLPLTAAGVASEEEEEEEKEEEVPKVVFIKRYKKTKDQNPRGGAGDTYNRVLGDPEQVKSSFDYFSDVVAFD
jgi:hypothetical protein